MKQIMTLATAVAVALVLGLQPGSALPLPATTTNDFDDLGHNEEIGDSQPGTTYNAGVRTLCAPSYNYIGFPPSSGDCVAYQFGLNVVDITFDAVATTVTFDVASSSNSVSVSGTDILGGTVQGDTGCSSGYGAYTSCGITSPLPLTSISITGDAFSAWVIDTVAFDGLGL